MEFEKTYKPLLKESFYLDLKLFQKKLKLISDLRKLGGKVEEFFSKDVSYVITDRVSSLSSRVLWSQKIPKSGASVQNSLQVGNATFEDSDPLFAASSPLCNRAKSHVLSRGHVLVQQAKTRRLQSFGTTDVLEVCRQLGIQILHVQNVVKWIEKVKTKWLQKKKNKLSQRSKVCKFVHPFIKVEDTNQLHRPLFKFKKHWPELIPSFPNNAVFMSREMKEFRAYIKSAKENCPPFHSDLKEYQEVWKYCEICGISYTHLDCHLNTEKHQQFMNNPDNYAVLQDISASFPSVNDFLLKVKQESCKDIKVPQKELSLTSTNFMDLFPLDLAGSIISNLHTGNCSQSQIENVCNGYQPQFSSSSDNKAINFDCIFSGKQNYFFQSEDLVPGSSTTPQASNDFPFLEDSMSGSNHCAVLIDGLHYLQGDTSLIIPFLNEMRYQYGNVSISPNLEEEGNEPSLNLCGSLQCDAVKNFVSTVMTECDSKILDLTMKRNAEGDL